MIRNPDFILASASPRRAEILRQIGACFMTMPADVDETPLPAESPEDYVIRLAREKAIAGWRGPRSSGQSPSKQSSSKQDSSGAGELPALGADTSVVLGEQILGKPAGESEAVAMLQKLSGKTHSVLSAVAMCRGDDCQVLLSETCVTFRAISEDECHRYWQTGEPADKAGAYGIQGLGAVFVDKIEGSYSGVVGLPVAETCQLLRQFSIPWWQTSCDALSRVSRF